MSCKCMRTQKDVTFGVLIPPESRSIKVLFLIGMSVTKFNGIPMEYAQQEISYMRFHEAAAILSANCHAIRFVDTEEVVLAFKEVYNGLCPNLL